MRFLSTLLCGCIALTSAQAEELFEPTPPLPAVAADRSMLLQSNTLTGLWGTEIIRTFVKRSSKVTDVIYLRNFTADKQTGNRRVAEREISSKLKASSYSKIFAIGELRNLATPKIQNVLSQLPCATDKMFAAIDTAKFRPDFISIIADNSWLSQGLSACVIRELRARNRKFQVTQINSVLELREHLRSLSERKPGLLVNAAYNIHNNDTLLPFESDRIILEMRRWNFKHLEIGVLKHEHFPFHEGITIGYSAQEIVSVMLDPTYVPVASLFVDPDRLDRLRMKSIYMDNITTINGATHDAEN